DTIGNEPGEMPPPAVALGPGNVVQLSGGGNHTCARFDDGTVRGWGGGDCGQLGCENDDDVGDEPGEMPPAVVDIGLVGAAHVSTGVYFTCVLLLDGNVKCWGTFSDGVLGKTVTWNIGDSYNEMPPSNVNIGGTALMLDSGRRTICVVMPGQEIRCWGNNDYGQLGIGSTEEIGNDFGEMPPMPVPIF